MTAQKVDEFMEWVATWSAGAHPPLFCYLATERDGQWALIKGVLYLNLVNQVPLGSPSFSVGDIRAGYFFLDRDPGALADFCGDLVTGAFNIKETHVSMTGRTDGCVDHIDVDVPLEERGNIQVSVSRLVGAHHGRKLGSPLSWLLRSAEAPFDDLEDLGRSYFLGSVGDAATIEVRALHAAFVDGRSTVHGTTADLVVKVLRGFDPALLRVGYRVLSAKVDEPPQRGTYGPDRFNWSLEEGDHKGAFSFEVGHGAVVQAFATYAGKTQQHWTFLDLEESQNPRRIAYETYDPNLKLILSWMAPSSRKAEEFEFAIRTVGWMLGFDGLHLDRNRKLGDGPDVLFSCPEGLIMVECTIGAFGSDKLAKLIGRRDHLLRRLQEKGRPDVQVFAVVATTRFESELTIVKEEAARHGIALLGQEPIAALAQRTYALPNTAQLVQEVRQLCASN